MLNKDTFGTVWTEPRQSAASALAFAFGFVERLIDSAANLTAGTLKSGTAAAAGAGHGAEPLPGDGESTGGGGEEQAVSTTRRATKKAAPRARSRSRGSG